MMCARPPSRLLFGLLLPAAFLFGEVAAAAAQRERTIRPSDVVFMYDNPEMYEPYGCTVLGWAGRGKAQHIEAAHQSGVRHFSTSIGFLTEFRRVIDFSDDFLDAACRNLAGEPFIVPWLWDHKHKQQPAWWWCTNSPLYRKYLDSRLAEAMAAAPDGLHIDDYRGTSGSVTWRSGCFCKHCMAGFREYLAKNVPKHKLDELGINDLANFDYRWFLLQRGVKPEQYNKLRAGLPLAAEFYDFQVKANTAFVADFRRRAEQLRGKPVSLCVNSGLTNPQALAIAPHLSYFCCEVSHAANCRAAPKHPIYIYKLADALDRPVTSTAGGQDWAYVAEHELPGLVRTWIALSYAMGHNFMAPHRQWCYTKEKGTHWNEWPPQEYAWLYRFVRRHARLLDGYEAVAPVAVLYDNAARRNHRGNIEPICTALAEQNVPFTVVIAGDDWLDYRLDGDRLAGFKAVVLAAEPQMDPPQRELIDRVRAGGRLVRWDDRQSLEKLVPSPVSVEGSDHVLAVPRYVPGQRSAPAVVHLLNRRYDARADAMAPQKAITLRLRRDLFGPGKFTAATLHAPKQDPVSLQLAADDEFIRVNVPALDLWAILELTGR